MDKNIERIVMPVVAMNVTSVTIWCMPGVYRLSVTKQVSQYDSHGEHHAQQECCQQDAVEDHPFDATPGYTTLDTPEPAMSLAHEIHGARVM